MSNHWFKVGDVVKSTKEWNAVGHDRTPRKFKIHHFYIDPRATKEDPKGSWAADEDEDNCLYVKDLELAEPEFKTNEEAVIWKVKKLWARQLYVTEKQGGV